MSCINLETDTYCKTNTGYNRQLRPKVSFVRYELRLRRADVKKFELSGDYAIALPLVMATAMATLVSRRLRRESIYTAELRQRGIDWEVTMEGRRVVE
jgi:hypothetical protein